MGLALSNRFSVEAAKELYAACAWPVSGTRWTLVGGDTTSSKSGLMISVTAIGEVTEKTHPQKRRQTRRPALVPAANSEAPTWGFRCSNAKSMCSKKRPAHSPTLTGYEVLLERQLKPEARVDVVEELTKARSRAHSMIDISDGLASEALHMSGSSGCGVRIYEDKIPMGEKMYETARAFNLDPTLCTLERGRGL